MLKIKVYLDTNEQIKRNINIQKSNHYYADVEREGYSVYIVLKVYTLFQYFSITEKIRLCNKVFKVRVS